MKYLDKYIIKTFITSLVIAIISLVGIYVMIDFFMIIDELLTFNVYTATKLTLALYFYKIPFIYFQLNQFIMMFSVVFLMISLMKRNEITPVLTSGVSLVRYILPASIIVFFLVLLNAFVEENYLTQIGINAKNVERIIKKNQVEKEVMQEDGSGKFFYAKEININKGILSNVFVYDKSNGQNVTVYADKGKWDNNNKEWILNNGKQCTINKEKSQCTEFGIDGYKIKTSLRPEEMSYRMKNVSDIATIQYLNSLIKRYPKNNKLYVQLYQRYFSPLIVFILVLLGFGVIMNKTCKTFFVGVSVAIIAGGLFYIAQFLFVYMGGLGIISPLNSALIPVIIFSVINLKLFKSIRT